MFTGAGSQTDTGRWGDYSMTTIDPADGMSFWTVGEYYANTSSFNWHTRIGKFNFQAGGQSPTPTPTATPPLAAGRLVRTCRPASAWLVSFSRPTGSFTPWAAGRHDGEFTHPFEYDPVTNTWTTKSATYPDTITNNMACGVLTDAGTALHLLCGRLQFTHPDLLRSRIPL